MKLVGWNNWNKHTKDIYLRYSEQLTNTSKESSWLGFFINNYGNSFIFYSSQEHLHIVDCYMGLYQTDILPVKSIKEAKQIIDNFLIKYEKLKAFQ